MYYKVMYSKKIRKFNITKETHVFGLEDGTKTPGAGAAIFLLSLGMIGPVLFTPTISSIF